MVAITATPQDSAQPSRWLSWFQSLRIPTKQDLLKTQAYVNSKWRCLRYGEHCSRKERALLVTLSALIAANLASAGKAVYQAVHKYKISAAARPLRFALRNKDINELKRLLDEGADPNVFDQNISPLQMTSHAPSVAELLKAGANPNIPNKFGSTPFNLSCL